MENGQQGAQVLDRTEMQEVARRAHREAERRVYTLDNKYLSQEDKVEVETWFQLPGEAMLLTFLGFAAWSAFHPIPLLWLIGAPLLVNIVLAAVEWWWYPRTFVLTVGMLCSPPVMWLVTIVGVATLALRGRYMFAAIGMLGQVGLLAVIEPHMYLFSVLADSRYNMHPKYAYFRRFYGRCFPFDEPA